MSKKIVFVLPHALGPDDARSRVAGASENALAGQGQCLVRADVKWPAHDHAELSVSALGQAACAQIEMEDTEVRVRIMLPWLLASFAAKIAERKDGAGAGKPTA